MRDFLAWLVTSMEFLTKWTYRGWGWAWQATLGFFWAILSADVELPPLQVSVPQIPFSPPVPQLFQELRPIHFFTTKPPACGMLSKLFLTAVKSAHTSFQPVCGGAAQRSSVRPAFFKCDTFAAYIRQRWFGQCAGTVCHILFMFLKFLHKSIQLLGWV